MDAQFVGFCLNEVNNVIFTGGLAGVQDDADKHRTGTVSNDAQKLVSIRVVLPWHQKRCRNQNNLHIGVCINFVVELFRCCHALSKIPLRVDVDQRPVQLVVWRNHNRLWFSQCAHRSQSSLMVGQKI